MALMKFLQMYWQLNKIIHLTHHINFPIEYYSTAAVL